MWERVSKVSESELLRKKESEIKKRGQCKKEEITFLLSASSLLLGFLAFEPPLLGLLGKGDCLSHVWGLLSTMYL